MRRWKSGLSLPGRGGEAAVAPLGGHVAPADGDAEELGAGVERRRGRSARLHGDALAEPAERGDDLAAGQADERVGAEDGRVVAVEGRVRRRSSQRHPTVDDEHLPGRVASGDERHAGVRDVVRRAAAAQRCRRLGPPRGRRPSSAVHGVSMSPGATAWTRISGPRALASSTREVVERGLRHRVRDGRADGTDTGDRRDVEDDAVARRPQVRRGGAGSRSRRRGR